MNKIQKIMAGLIATAALMLSASAQEAEKTEVTDFASMAKRFHEEGGVHNGGRDWLATLMASRSDIYETYNEWYKEWYEANGKYLDSFVSDDWTEYNKLTDEQKDVFLREMYFIGDFRNMDWPKFDKLVNSGELDMNNRVALTIGGGEAVERYIGSDAKGYFASVIANGFKIDGVKIRPEWQVEFMSRAGDLARIKELPLDWFNSETYRIKGGDLPATWAVDNYYLEGMCQIWTEMLNESTENALEVERQINNIKLNMISRGVPDVSAAYHKMNRIYIWVKTIQQ